MFTHMLILLCGCAYALGDPIDIEMPTYSGPRPPPYMQAWDEYKELANALKENLTSMSGNIPHFNDTRRHYAIIFNVINEEAIIQSGCDHPPYDEDYIRNLDESVPKAMDHPEQVIADTLQLLDSVEHHVKNISKLTEHCPGSVDKCNELIEEMVQRDREKLEPEAEVLLTAGETARQLNKQAVLHKVISDHLASLSFVITGQKVLKDPVLALADLHHLILSRQC